MKAQTSTEIMYLISVIIIIFLLTMLFTFRKNTEIDDTEDFIVKRNECSRIANAISYLNINGPGTKVRVKTDFIVKTRDNIIEIQEISNLTVVKNEIAIMASANGVTKQSFYDKATQKFSPDWYDNCYEGQATPNSGAFSRCRGTTASGDINFLTITWNMSQLMQNISRYNTVYLEDAHINTTHKFNGKTYINILEDWVEAGNVLIISEHFMCHLHTDPNRWCYSQNTTKYWFNLLGTNFEFFEGEIDNWDTIMVDDPYFSNYNIGDSLHLEEQNYVEDYLGNEDSRGFVAVARKNIDQFTPDPEGIVTIGHWDYGNGKVFYLADFYTLSDSMVNAEDLLLDLIENAYITLFSAKEGSEVFCKSEVSVDENYELTGKIELENSNGEVLLRNYE